MIKHIENVVIKVDTYIGAVYEAKGTPNNQPELVIYLKGDGQNVVRITLTKGEAETTWKALQEWAKEDQTPK